MHHSDIKAALAKRGMTLVAFDKMNGWKTNTTSAALRFGSPRVEHAVARYLDLPLKTLFPKRYTHDGQRLLPRERVDESCQTGTNKSTARTSKMQRLAS